jgi:hypothetical protein
VASRGGIFYPSNDPLLRPIWNEPRLIALMKKIGMFDHPPVDD